LANLHAVPDAAPPPPRPHADASVDKLVEELLLVEDARRSALEEVAAWSAAAQGIRAELVARMNNAKSKRLPHATMRIELSPNALQLDKRESEFLAILDLPDIPQREKDEMILRIVPTEPVLKTNATALKKYADLYGDDHPLAAIRKKALVYGERTYSLVVIPHEAPKKGLQ
jgi:hypothetical protein